MEESPAGLAGGLSSSPAPQMDLISSCIFFFSLLWVTMGKSVALLLHMYYSMDKYPQSRFSPKHQLEIRKGSAKKRATGT